MKLGTTDPRLSNRDWLQANYLEHGDMWIALELGVNRLTVRHRREKMGIASQPRGPRRGTTLKLAPVNEQQQRVRLAREVRLLAQATDPYEIDELLLRVSDIAAEWRRSRQQQRTAEAA